MTIPYNLGITGISRLVLGGISLLVVGFLTRSLGPEGYGYYSLIFAYLFIFTTLADLGLHTILVREISQPGADEPRITGQIFTLRLCAIILLVVLANIILWLLPYPAVVRSGVLIASLFTLFASLTQVLVGIFQRHLKTYYVSLADVIARLVQLGLIAALVGAGSGVLFFVWIVVISEIVHFLLVLVFARTLTRFRFGVDREYWKRILKSALPIAASLVFVLIYFKMDTVVLSLLKPAYDVGVYSVAYKILEAVIFLPAAYVGLVMPQLSRFATTDLRAFRERFRKSFGILASLGVPLTVYLYLLSDQVVRLVGGSGFPGSRDVLKILSLAVLLIFFGTLGGNSLIALNLQKKGMWIYLAGAAVNLVTNILFIPRYTYFAAAWTTVATEFLITLVMFEVIRRNSHAAPSLGLPLRAILAALVMGLFMYPFRGDLVVGSAVALSYVPLLWLVGGFSLKNIRDVIRPSEKKDPEDMSSSSAGYGG